MKKEEVKFISFQSMDFNGQVYLIALDDKGRMWRCQHEKGTNEVIWTMFPKLEVQPPTQKRNKELESEKLKCSECGKQNKTVRVRFCGYSREISGTDVEETICDACEHEHLMDI